jgi:uncharacterized protein YjaG (DUF416 family)
MAAFPSRKNGQLKYCASNQVGDAALLYARVLGPLWERTTKTMKVVFEFMRHLWKVHAFSPTAFLFASNHYQFTPTRPSPSILLGNGRRARSPG